MQSIDPKHLSFEYELDRDQFSKVFRAQWTVSNNQKTVAVKWFKQDEIDNELHEAFQNFIKEICLVFIYLYIYILEHYSNI